MNSAKIILIGYMGSGKSAIGVELGKALEIQVCTPDERRGFCRVIPLFRGPVIAAAERRPYRRMR